MHIRGGRGVCVRERVKEKEGERESERKEGEGEKERQVGQVLAYLTLTSMDMNLCFSALMSADLHKLWRRYTKTIYSFAISAGKAHPHPWTSLFT